jgi:hypothetical protein
VRGTLLPCDWAQAINGKLYAQGIGWSRVAADRPINIGLAVMIHVSYNETNVKSHFAIELHNEDGLQFPIANPVKIEGDFEVGRPAGMRAGEESIASVAANLTQIMLPPGGYTWLMTINDELVASYPFTAITGAL